MAKIQTGKNNKRMSDMKFKDIQALLTQNGYVQDRQVNGSHIKFINREKKHSVVVSGGMSKGSKVRFPIVQKVLKECGISYR